MQKEMARSTTQPRWKRRPIAKDAVETRNAKERNCDANAQAGSRNKREAGAPK